MVKKGYKLVSTEEIKPSASFDKNNFGGKQMWEERLTNKNLDEYYPERDFCYGCEYFGEPNGCNRWNGTCGNYDRFIEMFYRLAELEDKIESGRLVELPKPFIEQQKEEPYAWQVFHAKVDIFAAAGKDIFPKEEKEAAEARLKELLEERK